MWFDSSRPNARAVLVFAAGLAVATGLTFWLGLRATREWQHSTREAAETRANEVAALLTVALERDMKGGQVSVLVPFVYGAGVPDPDLGAGHAAEGARAVTPVHTFRAHHAPLGLAFMRGANLPAGYSRTALVALHGSWNRSQPDGYKVVALDWQPDGSIVERDFLTGFLGDAGVLGRPAGIAQGPDGAIFITDDYAGVIYRVVPATGS